MRSYLVFLPLAPRLLDDVGLRLCLELAATCTAVSVAAEPILVLKFISPKKLGKLLNSRMHMLTLSCVSQPTTIPVSTRNPL